MNTVENKNPIPGSWERVEIGALCDLKNGRAFKPTDWTKDGLKIVRIQNLNNPDASYNHYSGEVRDRFLIGTGDLLFAWSGTPGTSFGAHIWRGEKAVLNQHIFRVDFDESVISKKYFMYAINQKLNELIEKAHGGVGLRHVTKGKFERTMIELPPFAEQCRLVRAIEELLSEIDNGIENLKTAQEQLGIYRQAVLKHAFEGKLTTGWRKKNKDKLESANQLLARIQAERSARYRQQLDHWDEKIKHWETKGEPDDKPAKPRKPDTVRIEGLSLPDLPEGWVWEHLGNLNAEVFDGPFGSNLKTSDYVDEGVRVIRLENIGYLKFIEGKCSYVAKEKYERLKKHTVRAGDIVFASFIIDGIRLAILPDTIESAVNKADCFCVRLRGEVVRTDYVASFLSTRAAYKQIESEIHGVGRPRINTTQLKTFSIPLCSRVEQNEIISQLSEKLSLADNVDASIERQIDKCEVLRQSILKMAFSGKLVAQDPHDEPASILLERIKSGKAEKEDSKSKIKRKDAA